MTTRLHGSARTSPRIRAEIRASVISDRAPASRLGLDPKTVRKWRGRTSTSDAPMGPREPRCAAMSAAEEAVVVLFRRLSRLPLDALLGRLREAFPGLSRSALHRCLKRHGASAALAPPDDGAADAGSGHLRIGVCELCTGAGPLCVFLAVDPAAPFAHAAFRADAAPATAAAVLREAVAAFPGRVLTVATDGAAAFAGAPAGTPRDAGRPPGTAGHPFARACRRSGVRHRLVPARAAGTAGRVARAAPTEGGCPSAPYCADPGALERRVLAFAAYGSRTAPDRLSCGTGPDEARTATQEEGSASRLHQEMPGRQKGADRFRKRTSRARSAGPDRTSRKTAAVDVRGLAETCREILVLTQAQRILGPERRRLLPLGREAMEGWLSLVRTDEFPHPDAPSLHRLKSQVAHAIASYLAFVCGYGRWCLEPTVWERIHAGESCTEDEIGLARWNLVRILADWPHGLPARAVEALVAALKAADDGDGHPPALLAPKKWRRGGTAAERRLWRSQGWLWHWITDQTGSGRLVTDAVADVAEAVGVSTRSVFAWRTEMEKRCGREHARALLGRHEAGDRARRKLVPPSGTLGDLAATYHSANDELREVRRRRRARRVAAPRR